MSINECKGTTFFCNFQIFLTKNCNRRKILHQLPLFFNFDILPLNRRSNYHFVNDLLPRPTADFAET